MAASRSVTTSEGMLDSFKKIKIVEIMDLIRTDITATAEDEYVGKYANSYDNKMLLVTAVRGYFMGLEQSALVEIGNIMISTFINALSGLADVHIKVTVPAFAVDMQGAILTVPMAEYGGMSDYLMAIGGNFVCDGKEVPCHLLLSPDLRSLDFLLRKLGVSDA